MKNSIDLRSDTVTLPNTEMKNAMINAELGDDVYGEDPTVNMLELKAAKLLGKEAAIFAPSGTQSNLLALMGHCQRGDEYIVGQDAHTYKYEGGGAAVLGSIQPQPLDFCDDATLCLDKIRGVIKPNDPHFVNSKLICLENTHGGKCLPVDYPQKVREICDQHNLQLHLDGARLFNAVIKQQTTAKQLVKEFDSVSICLSKGLGAPAGSVLVGSQSLIDTARRWRKVLGGGMRQVGFLAAAGIYALDNNVERLVEDHERATTLALELGKISALEVEQKSVETNMLFVTVPEDKLDVLYAEAQLVGIKLPDGAAMRLVTHLDIDDAAVEQIIRLFQRVFS